MNAALADSRASNWHADRGPFAARMLGAFRRRVIKIEIRTMGSAAALRYLPPGHLAGWAVPARNRRSRSADLKDPPRLRSGPAGWRLQADIVSDNFRPGVLEKLALLRHSPRKSRPRSWSPVGLWPSGPNARAAGIRRDRRGDGRIRHVTGIRIARRCGSAFRSRFESAALPG